jgi:hypothetical protein
MTAVTLNRSHALKDMYALRMSAFNMNVTVKQSYRASTWMYLLAAAIAPIERAPLATYEYPRQNSSCASRDATRRQYH